MNNVPLLIQGTGLVLVTLLIPIWISLFRDKERQVEKLDEKVLVDYILEGKNILAYLGLIFIPPFLWYFPNLLMKTYSVVYPILGMALLLKNLIRALNWIRGEESQLRIDFLNSLKEFENTEEIWRSVWQTKNIDREKEYLDRFFDKLGLLIKNKKGEHLHILSDYLRDFKENLEYRDLRNILFEDYFSMLFCWYHDNRVEEKKFRKDKEEYPEWRVEKIFIIKRELKGIFEKNWRILIQNHALRNFIHRTFKKQINEWINNKVLLREMFEPFFNILLEETKDDYTAYHIWALDFPKDWKITKENWKKRDIVLEIIWKNYFVWAFNRFQDASDKIDLKLTKITEHLFPEVHFNIWVKILIFEFTRRENIRERLNFMIVRKWRFGMIMAKASFASEGGEDKNIREFEEEEKNAFDLAFELFGDDFSEEMLKEYISILKELKGKFEKDSIYEYRSEGILEMFKAMLEYRSKKK
jgi:hypothetical protein